MPENFTIGDAAQRTGLPARTIRYYEDIGVVPAPGRASSGNRQYGERDIRRLSLAKAARKLGLPLGEVRQLVGFAFENSCRDYAERALPLLERRHADVLLAIEELQQLLNEVESLTHAARNAARTAPAGQLVVECPHCLLIDDDDPAGSCCSPAPDPVTPAFSAATLDVLCCTIEERPAGAPFPTDLAPFYQGSVRRERDLSWRFSVAAQALVQAFAEAERECCPSLGWEVCIARDAIELQVRATPVQLDLLERIWGCGGELP